MYGWGSEVRSVAVSAMALVLGPSLAHAQSGSFSLFSEISTLASARFERRIDDFNERLLLQSSAGDPFSTINNSVGEQFVFGGINNTIESTPVAINYFEALQRFDITALNLSLQVKGSYGTGQNTASSIGSAVSSDDTGSRTVFWEQSVDETYDVARAELIVQRQVAKNFDMFLGAQLNRYEYRYDALGTMRLSDPESGELETINTASVLSNSIYYQQLRIGVATENAVQFRHVFFLNASGKARRYGDDDDLRNRIDFEGNSASKLNLESGIFESGFDGNTFLGFEAELGYQYRLNNRISLDIRYIGDVNWPLSKDGESSSWSSNGVSVGIDIVTF